jgi:acetyl esterase/lipase
MSYAYDAELAAAVPSLPTADPRDIEAMRELEYDQQVATSPPDTTGVHIEDRRIPGGDSDPDVPMRIYRPEQSCAPAAVYRVHGGGFIIGDLETEHGLNAWLTRKLTVVAVDYRLAPETPFPGPLEDVYTGLTWMADHSDARRSRGGRCRKRWPCCSAPSACSHLRRLSRRGLLPR